MGKTKDDLANILADGLNKKFKNYKDAKDSIERLSPRFTWRHTQYKIQQVFYKSFVQEAQAS